MKRWVRFVLLLLLNFRGIALFSQQEKLTHYLDSFSNNLQHTQLYIHLDKSIYTANEDIWFAAYLLSSPDSLVKHHTLYTNLTNRITHKVVASGKYVMESGTSSGSMVVPDSITAGEYILTAFTNQVTTEKFPQPFRQLINIRSADVDAYTINFDKVSKQATGDSTELMLRIIKGNSLYAKNAFVNYRVLSGDKTLGFGTGTVNQYGELPIVFYSRSEAPDPELQLTILSNNISSTISRLLPIASNSPSVLFYPEGGNLINGITNDMAFEIRNNGWEDVTGKLLANKKEIATLRPNSSGNGLIKFTPKSGSQYSIVLTSGNKTATIDKFPEVLNSGIGMQISNTVVDDTVKLVIASTNNAAKVQLMVHDYQEIYILNELTLSQHSLTVKIPTSELPAGLATITLFDELGNPQAETSFFSHYNKSQNIVSFTTDSLVYHSRSKVTLNLQARNTDAIPTVSQLSVAIVYSKRIDSLNYQDIVPYSYFKNYLDQQLIDRPFLYSMLSRSSLDLFLRTHGWTRYRSPTVDTLGTKKIAGLSMELSGAITSIKKKPGFPAELISLQGALQPVATDSSGKFKIPLELSVTNPEQELQFILNKKDKENYTVSIIDNAMKVHNAFATRNYKDVVIVRAPLPDEEKQFLNKLKTLSTAVVSSRSKGWDTTVYKSNACHDYVCPFNILNCKNHRFGGFPAIDGQFYVINGILQQYRCDLQKRQAALFAKVKGRSYPKEFYVADLSKSSSLEPEFQSTIYWSGLLLTNENGEISLSFYTNDLPGTFYCIAEGVSAAGVISGKGQIKVISK